MRQMEENAKNAERKQLPRGKEYQILKKIMVWNRAKKSCVKSYQKLGTATKRKSEIEFCLRRLDEEQ